MRTDGEFSRRIDSLDCTLFDAIDGQSNESDRRSWLAIQRCVRDAKESYTYLEIGSYLGGSVQQYLQDPRCSRIYSIDNRTMDARHGSNSEQTMLGNLRAVAPEEMEKLVCFGTDAREVDPRLISDPPDICFIDGRHAYDAVLSDFDFCMRVCAPDAVLYFHDAGRMRTAIRECLRRLRRSGRNVIAHKLPGNTFVVGLPGSPAWGDPRLRRMAVAVNGERWLRTTALTRRVRRWRWIPPSLRPALRGLRDRWWGSA